MPHTLTYVYDPICGWCFGFSVALDYVTKHMPELSVDIRLGGMISGNGITPYSTLFQMVGSGRTHLEQKTGAKFGNAFWDGMLPSESLMSSQPSNAAIPTVRTHDRAMALPYTMAIKKGHFVDGRDFSDPALYPDLANSLGLGELTFDIPAPTESTAALGTEYAATHSPNFKGYPSLFLAVGKFDTKQALRPVELSYDGPTLLKLIEAAALRM